MSKTPDEILSERIVRNLIEQKIISEKQVEKYRKSFMNGQMSREDWILLTEDIAGATEDASKN